MNVTPAPAFERSNWCLPLLVAGTLVMSWGVWKASVPAGDEGIHILQGIHFADNGGLSTNLYYMAYTLLFRTVTDDPIVAHLTLRLFIPLATTIGLYFVLTAFKSISRPAALLACLIWAASNYMTPYVQLGNINGLALAIILPGIAILLRYPTLAGWMTFLIFGMWAAMTRPEYNASLIVIGLCGLAMVLLNRASGAVSSPRPVVTLIVAAVLAGSAWTMAKNTTGGGLDQYLLQGLGQCYAVYYKERHPEEKFDAMTEYEPLLNRVFGNPKGFFEAVQNNPSEALKYFVINGSRNLIRVVPAMTRSHRPFKATIAKILLALGTLVGIAFLLRRALTSRDLPYLQQWPKDLKSINPEHLKVLALLGLAAGSSAAIILLIPDERYWITWAPLVYLWLAWAIQQILNVPLVQSHWRAAVAVLAVVLCVPHTAWGRSNQELIHLLRDAAKGGPERPVIAGNFVTPWAAILFRGRATALNIAATNPDDLRQGRYDIFFEDGVEGTARWQAELAFLKSFQASPEKFGYRNIVYTDGIKTGFYIRTRKPSE